MSVLSDDAGRKVRLPPWAAIDPTQVQLDTIAGNTEAFPSATAFANLSNAEKIAQMQKIFGLSPETFQQIGANIGDQSKGRIPKDVQDAIQMNAATRSLAGGFGGTGLSRNLVARDLGLTSLGLMNQAQDSASRWMDTYSRNFKDASAMFLTPEQRYGMTANERDLKFKYEYLKAQIAAMPDPGTRLLMDAIRNGSMYASGGWKGSQGTPTTQQQDFSGSYSGGGDSYFESSGSGGYYSGGDGGNPGTPEGGGWGDGDD